MNAEILTIGDELLRGEIVDSNKSFLSDRLLSLDIETRFHTSVCDDPDDMIDAFHRAAKRSDAVRSPAATATMPWVSASCPWRRRRSWRA